MSNRTGRRAYHHGNLRRALIDAALEMLTEGQGWDFPLREVARRAGVSHAAPYKHFSDKQELLGEVAALGFDALRAETAAAAERHPRAPFDQLRAIGEAYVAFATGRPAHFRLMFGPALAAAGNQPVLARAAEASRQVMVEVVTRCVLASGLGAEQIPHRVLAAWSLVHGLSVLLNDGLARDAGSPREAAAAVCEVFVRGLDPRGERGG